MLVLNSDKFKKKTNINVKKWDEQIKETKWWTDTFYTTKYNKNLIKDVDSIINYNLQESKQFSKQLIKNLV